MAAPAAAGKIPNKDLRNVKPEKQGNGDLDMLQQYAAKVPNKDLRNVPPEEQGTAPEEEETPENQPNSKPPQVPGPDAAPIVSKAKRLIDRIPRPQSLVFPLIIIAVFWLLIQRINGKTRIEWLFDVFTGQASLGVSNGQGAATFTGGGTDFAGGVGNTASLPSGRVPVEVEASTLSAFSDTPLAVTDLDGGSYQPSSLTFTSGSQIAVASEY